MISSSNYFFILQVFYNANHLPHNCLLKFDLEDILSIICLISFILHIISEEKLNNNLLSALQ